MSDDFDLAHDKLPDQPMTIGGDKSAAAWHPNSGPEVPHADLIARLREIASHMMRRGYTHWSSSVLQVSAALGDTVPREHYDREALSAASFERALRQAEDQRAEARAERDALAHVIEQVRTWHATNAHYDADMEELRVTLSTAPAVSLALHDAEVKAQAVLDFAASYDSEWIGGGAVTRFAAARAAAIREEAGS